MSPKVGASNIANKAKVLKTMSEFHGTNTNNICNPQRL